MLLLLLTIANNNHNRMCCNNGKQITIFPPFGNHSVWKKKNILIFANNRVWFSPDCTFFTIFRTICCVRFKNFYQQQSCKCANQDSEKFTRKNLSNSRELTTIWESNRQQICCCSGSGLYILTIWTESPRIVQF